ncbi:MAG: hypothetical protein KatS3mg105_3164 [Gemmatales bacterium]|nr:MAG: hypothetical protein KatS3mg105_3164 [Gemmatales bacterium]
MNNALDWFWPLVESPEPIVAAHVVAGWPAGVHQTLLDLGFLVQAADADRVLCPECHGHIEEVIANEGPDGTVRFFVPCPEVFRVCVPIEARRRWQVNLEGVANALAATLGLTGRCTELSPRRLWRLGRTTWQGSPRDVMLARGLHWDDATTVRAVVVRGRKPIVFVPHTKPPDEFWTRRLPPVLALSRVATLGESGIEVEPLEIVAAIQDAEDRASKADAGPSKELKLMIRQQIKAEQKTSLTDDIFQQAYRQCGSMRAAAAFLSEQTGREVSKDQVHRALQRAGGAAAVLNADNSDSIQRPVASQRRDIHGKPIRQSKLIRED